MTQDEALALLKTGASIFLTGQPGSGKTHTVQRYIKALQLLGIEYAYTASTGIAATHGHGVTIHAWSGIGVRERLDRRDLDTLAANRRLAARIERTSVLIIDEISMLPARSLSLVDAVCRHIRGTPCPVRRLAGGSRRRLLPAAARGPPRRRAANAPAWRRLRCLRYGVRARLAGLARSFADGLLFVRAAPAKRHVVPGGARRHPLQRMYRPPSRAPRRAADRQGPAARWLHAALHPQCRGGRDQPARTHEARRRDAPVHHARQGPGALRARR